MASRTPLLGVTVEVEETCIEMVTQDTGCHSEGDGAVTPEHEGKSSLPQDFRHCVGRDSGHLDNPVQVPCG
jgi:hypothetical protein